jgi:thiol-disulfide isomerase/thioredoxin
MKSILKAMLAMTILHTAAASAAPLENQGQAPEFTGIEKWLNTEPLTMQQLRGKVVLVDFWTYTCINCIHTLPYVKSWRQKYKDQGLAGAERIRPAKNICTSAKRNARNEAIAVLYSCVPSPYQPRTGTKTRHVRNTGDTRKIYA